MKKLLFTLFVLGVLFVSISTDKSPVWVKPTGIILSIGSGLWAGVLAHKVRIEARQIAKEAGCEVPRDEEEDLIGGPP